MRKDLIGALLGILPILAGQAWAINKCTSPSGKVAFQEAACAHADKGTEISPLYKAPPITSSSTSAPPETINSPDKKAGGSTYQQKVTELEKERFRREASDAIEYKKREMAQFKAACDQDQAAIRSQKARASNNLAGATWEQAISSEMSAAAARCDSQGRVLLGDLEDLRRTCQQRGCTTQ